MGFAEEYAKFPQPSPAREDFVYKAITSLPKEAIVKSMRPITVTRPDGAKISYKVMPDYMMIGGIRVPMSGVTAQRVANYFGLSLPTAAMAKEIYQKSDVKVPAKPLSGTGVTIGNQHYSNTDVTDKGVGYAPFALAYNDVIDKQLSDSGVKPGSDQIVSGFAKDIVVPPDANKLGLYGLFDAKGNPIQGGVGQTPHDTTIHTEYGSFVRLVSPTATITYPDGHTEEKPLDQVYQFAGNKYNTKPGKMPSAPSKPTVAPNQSGNQLAGLPNDQVKLLQEIDSALSQFPKAASRGIVGRMQFLKRLALKG
jgi:hypothetical protein